MAKLFYLLLAMPLIAYSQATTTFTLKAKYLIERTEKEMFLSKKDHGTLLLTTPGATGLDFLIFNDTLYNVKLENGGIRYRSSKYKQEREGKAIKVTETGETEVVAGMSSRKILIECTGRTFEVFIAKKPGYDNTAQLNTFFTFPKGYKSNVSGIITKVNVKTEKKTYPLIELQSVETCNQSLKIDKQELKKLVRKVLDDPGYDAGIIVTD